MSSEDGYAWSLGGMESDPDAAGSEPAQPPPRAEELPGRLDGYELLGEVGRGGMGAVFRARDQRSGELVAIKVIARADPQRLLRLRREGELAANLNHPGIVRCLGSGEAGGHAYLVYELVEGARPIDAVFDTAPLGRRVELVCEAARALGVAHDQGVLHRDVKPENLLIDSEGAVRVTDFGLARARGMETITQSGAVVGTPTHMAPEQLTGQRDVGPTADVWSLGVVLYQALTGALPFEVATFNELAVRVRQGRYDAPKKRAPETPEALDTVCRRALSPEPGQRYPDAGALADDLEAWLNGRPLSDSSAAPARPRGETPTWALGAALAAVVLLAVTVIGVVATPDSAAPGDDTADGRATEGPPEGPPHEATGTSGDDPGTSDDPSAGDVATGPLAKAPAWARDLDPARRPPLPLPRGLSFGAKPGEYVNAADGSVLVWVPAGRFVMGSKRSTDEAPTHAVELTRGYWIGKYEVTLEQFHAFCDATGRNRPLDAKINTSPRQPVNFVSWNDALAYCRWAGLELPTEAQWELAARSDDARTYPWGDAPDPSRCNAMGEDDGHRPSAPVGSYPQGASPSGCLDMAGNVFEWVRDGAVPYRFHTRQDPFFEPEPAPARVIRGGSFTTGLAQCTTTFRDFCDPETWSGAIGFRVSRGP